MVLLLALLLGGDRGGKIAWRTDLDAALRDGRRPILLYFTADW